MNSSLRQEIKEYIDRSVLCWLATSSADNTPNVSPKEVFSFYSDSRIIIANIASPKSVANILTNDKVCLSFIDILAQKGYQLHGNARIIDRKGEEFAGMEKELLKITERKFPFANIIEISITKTKKIIAPKYILYPETTEAEQIESAKKTYNL